jgi:hypothetical protein
MCTYDAYGLGSVLREQILVIFTRLAPDIEIVTYLIIQNVSLNYAN